MKIIPTSVLCRNVEICEAASIYYNRPGPGEKRHAPTTRYLQLEGKLESGVDTITRVAGFDRRTSSTATQAGSDRAP
jgi:hypothetical protein